MKQRLSRRPSLRRLNAEDGVVIPVTIAILALALLVVAVAAASAGFSNDASNRDRLTKRAIQAANAGVSAALYRMNKLDVTHQLPPNQCVGVAAGGSLLGLVAYDVTVDGNWCRPVTESLGTGAGYSYRVKLVAQAAGQTTLKWTIVSTGSACPAATASCANPALRRVTVTASALTGQPLFGAYGVTSLDDLNLDNGSLITANSQSNGNINLTNSARICGNATPGPGKSVTFANSSSVCPGFSTTAATTPITLSPVNQGNVPDPSVNDNGRICAAGGDPCTGTGANKVQFSPTTRRLSLPGNSTLTLGGSLYSFCQVDLQNNSKLIIAPKSPGSSVRIYIDSPEACGAGYGGFSSANGTSISNLNADPTSLQLYVVGSTSQSTSVTLANNSQTTNMVVYAPNSTVVMDNRAGLLGAIAAKKVSMKNNDAVTYNQSVANLTTTGVFPLFRQQGYHECTPAPPGGSTDPAAGC